MALGREDQLDDVGDEALFKVRSGLVLVELPVQVGATLMQERMGAKTKDVIVGVVSAAVRRRAKRAREECLAVKCSGGFLRGVVTHCPVPLVEKFLVVAARALGEGRQVQHFGGKAHGYIFPDGRV